MVPAQGNMDLVKLKKALDEMTKDVKDSAEKKSYEFWSTQPVPKIDEEITTNEAIEPDVPLDQLRQEPYSLPQGFEWDTLNLDDPLVLKELYVLLNENYVEDDDNMFRFDYSPEFLRWALLPPGFLKEWHVGVRATKSRKLVGFISAVPASVSIYKKTVKMVEINFLCVHKKPKTCWFHICRPCLCFNIQENCENGRNQLLMRSQKAENLLVSYLPSLPLFQYTRKL